MRHPARLAWGLWMLALAAVVTFLILIAIVDRRGLLEYGIDPITALYALLMMSYPTIGALIASRRPENSIGWLFLATGAIGACGFAAQLYADLTLNVDPGSLPAGEVAAWLSSWAIPLGLFVGPLFLLFLFPDGHAGDGAWRGTFRVVLIFFLVTQLGGLFEDRPSEPFAVANPFAPSGALGEVMSLLGGLYQVSPIFVFPLGILFLVARFRRSRGARRQQMKWFSFPAACAGASVTISFVFSATGPQLVSDIFFLIGALFLFCIPVASAVAILRYRLYDIDVIVNRTLVYGSLTAVLVGIYLAVVLVMQAALAGVTSDSDLAVAASTLAVAALFRPLRARVQQWIDRRFYRHKYDAALSLERFTRRLRDEVDLDVVEADVLGVLTETVRPVHSSLWLNPERAI